MKGYTNIPYARQAAELINYPEPFIPDYDKKDFGFWARLAHFENRYATINQLLKDIPAHNILELSSGFSFRGLDAVQHQDIHYIDTDLPGIIELKKQLLKTFLKNAEPIKGQLEVLPLNALDEQQFNEIVNHFEDGPLVIVNEGLLMYLNTEEKQKLCSIIRKVLKERGGYWITADIYIRQDKQHISLQINDKLQQFLDQHNIEENKFASLEQAEEFFKQQGFEVDKEAEPEYRNLISMPYLLKNSTPGQIEDLVKVGKIHTTWRLKLRSAD